MLRMLFQLLGSNYASGNFGGVEAVVRTLLTTVPNDMASLQFLGLVYYRTGRRDEAVRVFDAAEIKQETEVAQEFDPSDDILARSGKKDATTRHIEATRPNGETAQAWYDLGLTHSELNRPEQAVLALRFALSVRPDFPEARQALKSVASRMDEADTGKGGFSRLLTFESPRGGAREGRGDRNIGDAAGAVESLDEDD
jgi:tetratricopeptide (TPR) repeat protein